MNVIMVTINYRVGVIGFLSLDTVEDGEVSNTNFGLLDQAAAIQWVHDNIHAFGGDPTRITVHGQSAGASSSSFHMLDSKISQIMKVKVSS